MASHDQRQREVLEIILAASGGEITDEQRARLSQLIVEDKSLAVYAVELLHLEGWLSWHGSQAEADALLNELATHPYPALVDFRRDSDASEVASLPVAGATIGRAKQNPTQDPDRSPSLA